MRLPDVCLHAGLIIPETIASLIYCNAAILQSSSTEKQTSTYQKTMKLPTCPDDFWSVFHAIYGSSWAAAIAVASVVETPAH